MQQLTESQKAAFHAIKNGDIDSLRNALLTINDIDCFNENGDTLLSACLRCPNYDQDIARLLIENGVNINQQQNLTDSGTVLFENAPMIMHALVDSLDGLIDSSVFYLLLNHPKIDLMTRFSDSNIFPERTSKPIVLQYHHECFQLENAPLLHFLVGYGEIELVKALLATEKVDVNATATLYENRHLLYEDEFYDGMYNSITESEDDHLTPQKCPPKNGLLGYSYFRSIHGIPIRQFSNVTPAHLACRLGDRNMIELLRGYSAKFYIIDSAGRKPVDYLREAEIDNSLTLEKSEVNYVDRKLDKKRYKKRLMVGEADFSFTHALTKKHQTKKPFLGRYITATEYRSEESIRDTYREKIAHTDHIDSIRRFGVSTQFNVDATVMANPNAERRLEHITRKKVIHFNCPYDGKKIPETKTAAILAEAFQQAAQLQKDGDKFLLAGPYPRGFKKDFYTTYVYNLLEVSARAGYRLTGKRPFDQQRYPDYKHQMTTGNGSAKSADQLSEFVFVKTSLNYNQIIQSTSRTRKIVWDVEYLTFDHIPNLDKHDNDSYNSYTDEEASISEFSQ